MAGETKEYDYTAEPGSGNGNGYSAPGNGGGRDDVYTNPTEPTNPTNTGNPNPADPTQPQLKVLLPNGLEVPIYGQYVTPLKDTFVYIESAKVQIFKPLNEQIKVTTGTPVKYLGEYGAVREGDVFRATSLLVLVYVYKVPTPMWIDADVTWQFGVYPEVIRDNEGKVVDVKVPTAQQPISSTDNTLAVGMYKINKWLVFGLLGLFLFTRKRKRK